VPSIPLDSRAIDTLANGGSPDRDADGHVRGIVMTDDIRGDFAGLRSIWRTVSDTDKVGVVTRLEGLLRRSREPGESERDPDLGEEIQGLITEIRSSQTAEPA
jgi:hypothetical protein